MQRDELRSQAEIELQQTIERQEQLLKDKRVEIEEEAEDHNRGKSMANLDFSKNR